MDTRTLSYIIAIAEEKSISKAAERLYMAQSSLSQYLTTLETGSIINVGVRKYSFLTPFLHKKVDIDGIHSYN